MATYTVGGLGPSAVMMGMRPSFFLFLLATEAEAELVPFPFAPAIKGIVVEDVVGDSVEGSAAAAAAALTALTFAVVADFDLETGAGAGAWPEFVDSFEPFIFAIMRQTEL